MTPALALVIANIVAFYFSVKRTVSLRFVAKKRTGTDGYVYTFDATPIEFSAGQYIEVTVPHRHMDARGMRRVFTIIGRPNDDQLQIATRIPADTSSSFKRTLASLQKGQVINGTRIAGDFVLPVDATIPILFVAGGIGITPLISFLLDAKKRTITVIYVVSSVADMMFVDELRQYDIRVVVVTKDSRPLPDNEWHKETGDLTKELLAVYIHHDDVSPHVYISGPPAMVTSAKNNVQQIGIKTIKTDHFTGY